MLNNNSTESGNKKYIMKIKNLQAVSSSLQLTAKTENTEKGAMSNAQVDNESIISDFKSEWLEGVYDEWIFVYNPNLKLLLITYANSDFENIYERLVSDISEEKFTSKAEKIARNVEKSEVAFAVKTIVSKDDDYFFVNIDWSDKKDVESFIYS